MNTVKKIINFKTIIVLLAICGLVATTTYFYSEYQENKQDKNISANAKEEKIESIESIVSNISQYMNLPTDEEPMVATITDEAKLQDQKFFKKAKNGDKILMYPKASKAILYRPSTQRVIEFSALMIDVQTVEAEE